MTAYVRLSDRPTVWLRHIDRHEPPACNVPTEAGWCIRDEGHNGSHLPLPANYPPRTDTAPRKTDGGPSLVEFLRQKGEIQ